MRFWWGPNNATREAVRNPRRYALISALGVALLAGVGGGASSGVGGAIAAALGAFVIIGLLNLWLWRENGPGALWASRHGVKDD